MTAATELGTYTHPDYAQTVSARQVPWLKLGKITEGTMSAEEAIVAGHLDFTVSMRDTAFSPEGAHDGKTWTESPHRKMVVRDDTEEPYDFVSPDYKIVQYRKAFEFLDSIEPRYVAAGALKGGRQGFLVAELPGSKELSLLNGDDPHEMYVVLRTSHDRTRKIEVSVMPLRMRCMNQLVLRSFSQGAKHRWVVGHVGNVDANLAAAKASLKNVAAYCKELDRLATRLAEVQVDHERAGQVLRMVLPDKPKREENVGTILGMMANDPTVGYAGTGWGLVNAVSSYYDWSRIGGSPESRFTAALNGQTFNAINKTMTLVLSRV